MNAVMSPAKQGQSRQRWVWIVASVAVVAAVAAGAVFALRDGDSDDAAGGTTYRQQTDECVLVSAAVLTRYVPGATCKRTPSMTINPDEITQTPSWTSDSLTHPTSIQAVLRLVSKSPSAYSRAKASLVDVYQQQLTGAVTADVATAELGPLAQEAFVVSGASKSIPGRSDGRIVVRAGNAVVDIVVTDWTGAAGAEAAAKAVAADFISNLR